MIEQTAALSVDSPQSILQSAMDNVPLGGGTAVAENNEAKLDPKPKLTAAGLTLGLRAKSDGRAHVFAWTGTASVAAPVY